MFELKVWFKETLSINRKFFCLYARVNTVCFVFTRFFSNQSNSFSSYQTDKIENFNSKYLYYETRPPNAPKIIRLLCVRLRFYRLNTYYTCSFRFLNVITFLPSKSFHVGLPNNICEYF